MIKYGRSDHPRRASEARFRGNRWHRGSDVVTRDGAVCNWLGPRDHARLPVFGRDRHCACVKSFVATLGDEFPRATTTTWVAFGVVFETNVARRAPAYLSAASLCLSHLYGESIPPRRRAVAVRNGRDVKRVGRFASQQHARNINVCQSTNSIFTVKWPFPHVQFAIVRAIYFFHISPTAIAVKIKQSVVASVRPFVSTLSFKSTDLWTLCVERLDHSSPWRSKSWVKVTR